MLKSVVVSIDLNLAGIDTHRCACRTSWDCRKQLVFYPWSNDHARSKLVCVELLSGKAHTESI